MTFWATAALVIAACQPYALGRSPRASRAGRLPCRWGRGHPSPTAAPLLFQEAPQRACPGRVLLLAQRLGLDLADALARERPFLMPGARERKRARAAMEETGDGVRAWLYLRRVEDYEAAWRAQTALAASAPAFEPGPFPIRIQTPGDLHAARFDLLAWQDPHDTAGFPSPFWVQEGMVEAELAGGGAAGPAGGRRRGRGRGASPRRRPSTHAAPHPTR